MNANADAGEVDLCKWRDAGLFTATKFPMLMIAW